ncbi:helix-turn-helix transcriptional regulator [Acuticoccus sp.]|uniref:helix-turn-helix transcriptional regulator n=1 Tax=Acuticoccus sp. TaxID=1904378 RepID=UPI003B521C0D
MTSVHALLDGLSDRVVILDGDRCVTWWNLAATKSGGIRLGPLNAQELLSPFVGQLQAELHPWPAAPVTLEFMRAPSGTVRVSIVPLTTLVLGSPSAQLERGCVLILSEPPIEEITSPPDTVVSIDGLTRIERQLVEHITQGKTVRVAAAEVGIAYNTARKYMQRVYAKMGVKKQGELGRRLNGGPQSTGLALGARVDRRLEGDERLRARLTSRR